MGYTLVSAGDAAKPWCSLDAAQKHISHVECAIRASAKSNHANHHKILDAEMTVRAEWTRIAQREPTLDLSDIVEIVSHRHTNWPIVTELRNPSAKGWSNRRNVFNPYRNNGYRGHGWNSASSWQAPQTGKGKGVSAKRELITPIPTNIYV